MVSVLVSFSLLNPVMYNLETLVCGSFESYLRFFSTTVFCPLMLQISVHLGAAFEEYSRTRNPDAEAICDLAMYNYIEVR